MPTPLLHPVADLPRPHALRNDERAEYLVQREHREAAEAIHQSLSGQRIRDEQRLTWPGRRSDDHRGWIAAVVVALLAVLALSVPPEWQLPAPHTTQACR